MNLRVPYFRQKGDDHCGPACLRMILALYGKKVDSEAAVARVAKTSSHMGTSRVSMVAALHFYGLAAKVTAQATWKDLDRSLKDGVPAIVMYREHQHNMGHYALVIGTHGNHVLLHDPLHGEQFRIPRTSFLERWLGYRRRDASHGWMLTVLPENPPQPPPFSSATKRRKG